jgi:hypothetical protein
VTAMPASPTAYKLLCPLPCDQLLLPLYGAQKVPGGASGKNITKVLAYDL